MSKQNALKTNKNYTYNSSTQKYVFHTEKKFGKNLVFTKTAIDSIVKLYSDITGGLTANEIALKMSIPVDAVRHILKVMNITHDTLPYTEEVINSSEEDTLVDDAISSKKFNILQKFEKRDWKETQEDAEKWRAMKTLQFDPFEQILQNWTPPAYVPPRPIQTPRDCKDTLLLGLSDWHYGLVAHERYLYNQKEWNIEKTKDTVEDYARKAAAEIRKGCYKEVKLLLLGDMSHTLTGFTDKGTKLEAHPIAEEQLEVAFESLVNFVKTVLSSTNNVSVVACSGNHSALGDYVLARMLSLYFKGDKRIKFEVTNKRFITFNVGNSLFLMEHGYSSVAKDRLPAPGKGRENYINNLFMAKPEQMIGVERKYYLSADQHHSESYELTNVEGFMFPTLVGGCRHSDNSGYNSRQRQTALIVNDKEGVTSVKYFYFD
jgi:hypothetical protein